jgi:hypothetical protein
METTVKTSKSTLPVKEADFNSVAIAVALHWEKNPQITLPWTNPAAFKAATATFGTSFATRAGMKGTRRSVTQDLKEMNKEIDTSIEPLKGYMVDIFGKKNAPAHYEVLGIVRIRNIYKLPADNDRRLYALEQLLKGIETYDLADRKYGKAYWEDVFARFSAIKQQAFDADKTSAEHISIKTELRKEIRRTLNALILIIKAYNPDTWKEELRVWGFQKEKY